MQENQRVALTKRLLREGLIRLLQSKPIDKINVTELCKESGINRATFYRHYELPRDVLYEIENEFIQEMREIVPKMKSPDDAEQAAENILRYLYERSDMLKVLISCKSDENFAHVLNEVYQGFLDMKGEIRGVRDLDDDSAKLLSTFCVGGIYFLLRQWLVDGIDKSPKEISDLIFRFIDKGSTF